jgi:hypothetical protein
MLNEHEIVFFEFLKQHPFLSHLKYREESTEVPSIFGVPNTEGYTTFIGNIMKTKSNFVLDPNWDELYNSFCGLDHNLDSIDYMKSWAETCSREDRIDMIVKFVQYILPSLDCNKLYVVIFDGCRTDWLDEIVEV